MPRSGFLALGVACLALVSNAHAIPSFGRNCSECHSSGPPPVAGAPEVIGFDGFFDPDESGTGATDRGSLKFFEVAPGGSVDLTVRVDLQDLEDYHYAVELKRMEANGVENGGTLQYTADPDWFFQTGLIFTDPTKPYFTIPENIGNHYDGVMDFTFTMLVDAATDPDYYDLEFAMAGQPNFFYNDEHFYLHVTPEPATALLMALGLGVSLRRTRTRRGR